MTRDLLPRLVVPERLSLLYRSGETLGYNPVFNVWHRLDAVTAEMLRWLRAGRERKALSEHLERRLRMPSGAGREQLRKIIEACILRRLLYLDRQRKPVPVGLPERPLATVYWICTQACNLRCTYCYQDATVARSL